MSLYLGKQKIQVPKVSKTLVNKVPKAFFDAGGKFQNLTATSVDGWFLHSDTSNVTNMSAMFSSCSSLTSVPAFDTSKVTSMANMFYHCYSLTSVPSFDTLNVTSMSYMFNYCSSLTEIHMTGMKVSFDISASTKFTESALVEILNNLASVTSTQTLTMGSTNLAKLTDDEKAIATGKGWTLK